MSTQELLARVAADAARYGDAELWPNGLGFCTTEPNGDEWEYCTRADGQWSARRFLFAERVHDVRGVGATPAEARAAAVPNPEY